MNQGTILGSQIGRWIILAAVVVVLGALLLVARPAGAQDNGTIEFPENSTDPVAIFTDDDPEDDMPIIWAVLTSDAPTTNIEDVDDADRVDGDDFKISATGVLTFNIEDLTPNDDDKVGPSPDFENPEDDGANNTYNVVVQASDPAALGPKSNYHKVVVEVTNVDEDGVVTWTIDHTPDDAPTAEDTDSPTLLQFQPGDIVWAVVMDGDLTGAGKNVENVIWRWYRSPTNSPTGGTLIEGANSGNYQVQDKTGSDDVGMYLRAEASYTDGSGPVVTASRVSDYPVQAFRTNNATPNFGADTSTTRMVYEGGSGMKVGAPVTATDDNGDVLNYTLGGTDEAKFDIDQKTGQITTAVRLDFEATAEATNCDGIDDICVVTVRATDSAGAATDGTAGGNTPDDMTVTITLKNVNEKPAFGDPNIGTTPVDNVMSRAIAESATGDELRVANYTAADLDANDTVLISLRGDDAALFQLADDTDEDDGEAEQILSFKVSPNYEDPKDKDGDNIYEVIVRASDRGNLYSEKFLTVRVSNVDEAPYFMKDTPTSYEFAENGKEAVATFTATDPEGAKISWTLGGDDGGDFNINANTGVLTFSITIDPATNLSPDFENAQDNGE